MKIFLATLLLLSFAASAFCLNSGATLVVSGASALNIREGPCTSHRVVKSVSEGTQMTFTGKAESGCGYTWYSVNVGGVSGYAVVNFLKEVSNNGGGSNTGASISVDALRKIMPNLSSSKANQYIGYLNSALAAGNINTCCRKSAFLAQLAHESGDLNWFVEFASGAAYEGRKDLGNIYPGDGVRYKGRGPIQITGRANYRAAGQGIGIDLENNPTRAADPDVGFKTAVWFWNSRSLNQYADQCNQSGFDVTTKRINGGYNGKADRDAHWNRGKLVLGC